MFEQLKNHQPKCININKVCAVLIPLIKINNEYHILFEIRSPYLKNQPGEICFPGGRKEECDCTTLDTAIRETKEELQIQDKNIHIFGPLDYYMNPNGTQIDAYLGELINYTYTFNEEVESVFTVPLSYFLENEPDIYMNTLHTIPDSKMPFNLIPDGKDYKWAKGKSDVPFYIVNDKVIWGLTARILYHNMDKFR